MENDSVRSLGDNTLVDLWIEGRFRAITVTREAVEGYLRLGSGEPSTESDRREFVRTHLSLVVSAATARLRAEPAAEAITIDRLGGGVSSEPGERRSGDRRKGERRKANIGPPGGVERRRR